MPETGETSSWKRLQDDVLTFGPRKKACVPQVPSIPQCHDLLFIAASQILSCITVDILVGLSMLYAMSSH